MGKDASMSALEMRDKVSKLRSELIDVMERFGMENPEIPAQVLMAGLGELLIQFSVGQVGPGMTSNFLDDLKEAVQTFGPEKH